MEKTICNFRSQKIFRMQEEKTVAALWYGDLALLIAQLFKEKMKLFHFLIK